VPIVTASVTILGTATRATYTMSGPSSYATDEDSRVRATGCSMCVRATSAVPAPLRGDMILVSPTIDSLREERPGFRSGRS